MTAKQRVRAAEAHHPRSKRRQRAAVQEFSPNRGILLFSKQGVTSLTKSDLSPDRVGWKAIGLCCLPAEWVPRFFVVDDDLVRSKEDARVFEARVFEGLAKLTLDRGTVIVRSSGCTETIEERGRLVSETCSARNASETIHKLSQKLSQLGISQVHWIVQENIYSARKGHLSNERRLTHEPRDFVAEFEPRAELHGYTTRIGVRHWRDGDEVTNFDLACNTEVAVGLKLRRVALWASALPSRVLLEWVWSGTRVWVVQADIAKLPRGVNPSKLRPKEIPRVHSQGLKAFHVAQLKDFERYRKLRNAKTYSGLGYQMPTFFVLDDQKIIAGLLRGDICRSLEEDLTHLILRPVMIRTDGTDIPSDKREMLPRSEDLRTLAEAKDWLRRQFPEEINRIGIGERHLSLIVHHFIPSIAAAWARSEPSHSIVRIESLWGLPEGLYWHSHDTFEIDTENLLPARWRLRFKGSFVAPSESGGWAHYRPCAPFDWGRSVSKQEWLLEIAKTTKRIAELEKHAVAVMWFIDNDPRVTAHKILPWYHAESAIGTPKAAPRRKLTMASDFTIETAAQWQELKSLVESGKRVERILLEPKDPELVRNQKFAKELAEFAANHKIVIELAGGILSHAYHMLLRHGAQVECIDLYGAEEERIDYNKLVRDKVPELIERRGEEVEIVRLKGEALLEALRRKLVEESYEALDARGADIVGELADIQEVIRAICDSLQVSSGQLDAECGAKRKRRGGFGRGLMLKKTSTPHTLTSKPGIELNPSLPTKIQREIAVIEQTALLPANPPYRRPDRRQVDLQPEALLTFETELSRLGISNQSAVFEIPIDENETRSFKVSIELERDHSSLWGQIKLRLEPSQMTMRLRTTSQMELDFPETKS